MTLPHVTCRITKDIYVQRLTMTRILAQIHTCKNILPTKLNCHLFVRQSVFYRFIAADILGR